MKHLKLKRIVQLEGWINILNEVNQEFPGDNTNINTAISSFELQLKELKKSNDN